MTTSQTRYAKLAWGALGFNLFVIVWGAYVRASKSGAGCGSHWPLCNGEVVPTAPAMATVIELTHRLTSGVALLLVIALVIGAMRLYPRRHAVRRAAGWSGFFIVSEALIGAGLVLLEKVADDVSVARGFWVAGHLLNTFVLVAVLSLTAWWASGFAAPRLHGRGTLVGVLGAAIVGVLLLGVSGAITALGDTLFRVETLAEAKAMTFSESSHIFVRLRIWHPTLAIAVGMLVVAAAWVASSTNAMSRRLGGLLMGLYLAQLAVGLLNVWFLAPIGIQLVHLLLSDLLWIALVLMSATALAPIEERVSSLALHRTAAASRD